MVRLLRGLRLGYELGRNAGEVELLGRCECGRCDFWGIRFRGRVFYARGRQYRRISFMLAWLSRRSA